MRRNPIQVSSTFPEPTRTDRGINPFLKVRISSQPATIEDVITQHQSDNSIMVTKSRTQDPQVIANSSAMAQVPIDSIPNRPSKLFPNGVPEMNYHTTNSFDERNLNRNIDSNFGNVAAKAHTGDKIKILPDNLPALRDTIKKMGDIREEHIAEMRRIHYQRLQEILHPSIFTRIKGIFKTVPVGSSI